MAADSETERVVGLIDLMCGQCHKKYGGTMTNKRLPACSHCGHRPEGLPPQLVNTLAEAKAVGKSKTALAREQSERNKRIQEQVERLYRKSPCEKCQKEVLWYPRDATTFDPIDARPGTFYIVNLDDGGNVTSLRAQRGYFSHFITCPHSAHFNK